MEQQQQQLFLTGPTRAASGSRLPLGEAAPASAGLGLLGVGLALLGYGCGNAFVVLAKRRAARARRQLHPIAATLLGSGAILVLGLPLGMLGTDLQPRWPSAYGLLGGLLWAPGKLAIVLCTMGRGGMGVATATTSGSAVVVSFIAGIAVLGEPWKGAPALLFIALMIAGIAGVSAARELAAAGAEPRGQDLLQSGAECSTRSAACRAPSGLDEPAESLPASGPRKPPTMALELLLCVGTCALGGVGVGCSMLPLMLDPEKDSMAYLAGYCLGQFAMIASVAAFWNLRLRAKRAFGSPVDVPPLAIGAAVLPMGGFGALFVLGYLGSELAASAFGLSVGFPVSQTSVVVAGLVSVALGEVRGRCPVAAFLVSCLAVVGGALGLKLA